ncbi:MAG: nitronate monooxygenase [Tepidisphaeraceae bacterium]|jgi:nitronate monooxygenase
MKLQEAKSVLCPANPIRHPRIIQGGMGVGVSGWALARAVSRAGQLGVVSGTALAIIMARRLQLGDLDGEMRRALEHFPVAGIAGRIIDRYYIPDGKAEDRPFKAMPFPAIRLCPELLELTVASNFAEVFLAKDGHTGMVGVNYLEKLQIPTLASLFGAMLAGVDYVLIGAGVPRSIPGALDRFAGGQAAQLRVDISDLPADEEVLSTFDPAEFCGGHAPTLTRPRFLAIISSATLATALARKSNGRVDGFIIEGSTAGGHNAPPRGPAQFNARGEPRYGPLDAPDLERIAALGLPFWLAGSYADPGTLEAAERLGATGIQVGTAFAFCEESGIAVDLKQRVMDRACAGTVDVLTDPAASPTGFPFKVVQMEATLSEAAVYESRTRQCDIGYLRSAYRKTDGSTGHRCAAEPVDQYVRKGGKLENTCGRKCLCNGLLATIGLGQLRADGELEPAILTAGDDVARLGRFLHPGGRYTAAEVVRYLLSKVPVDGKDARDEFMPHRSSAAPLAHSTPRRPAALARLVE